MEKLMDDSTPIRLDRIDRKILRALSADGRISWSDLAQQVGLSVTPTLRRVRQMEESGLIRGYRAELDTSRLLGTMPVFISITMERQVRGALDIFEAAIEKIPEIMGGYLMSGGNDYMLHAFVRSLDHYRDLLAKLTEIEVIGHIQSSFVLKSFLHRPAPLLGSD